MQEILKGVVVGVAVALLTRSIILRGASAVPASATDEGDGVAGAEIQSEGIWV